MKGFDLLKSAKRIVVKVGSSLVTNEGRGLDQKAIGEWCRQMSILIQGQAGQPGIEVIMVSSGAIAEGMKRLGWATRPKAINELQAAAAVGQMGLAQMYETKLREHGLGSAQVLLTHADLADRERYLNARSTLLTLLKLGVLPVIKHIPGHGRATKDSHHDLPATDASASQNHRVALRPVIATCLLVDDRRPAKVAHPDHQCLIQQSAFFEIVQQRGKRNLHRRHQAVLHLSEVVLVCVPGNARSIHSGDKPRPGFDIQ